MSHLSISQIEQWMSNYYENPQPELTPIVIATLREEQYLNDESVLEQIMFFLSFIFRAHPEQIPAGLAKFQDLPNQARAVILQALWYANTKQARDYLATLSKTLDGEMKELVACLQGEYPSEIEQLPIDSPRVLDILWTAFMATGDTKYVQRIISVLPYATISEDLTQKLIGETAKWSLRSNAVQNKKVLSICVNQLTEQTEEVASILQEIISDANQYPT